jgi:peptidoglycan/LPS O-acetylase OafA/YrhL
VTIENPIPLAEPIGATHARVQENTGRSLAYRPGIDGLRAVAVLGVFIFHLNPRWLPGGFVGVDVFFVISGFLITQILLREFEHGSFGLGKFYQRRIARLFPAFLAMALLTLAGTIFVYSAQDISASGANAAFAALWLTNLKLMLFQGNYFIISKDAQPFLHCWSLSVEEQFYVFFPTTLLLIYKIGRRLLVPVMGVMFAISLIACIYVTIKNPVPAFFLLPTRAWELLAGGILARFYKDRSGEGSRICHWTSALGMALVLGSYVVIHESQAFPGYQAMLPVVGAVLFIGPNQRASGWVEKYASWKPAVLMGRMSYSLYLWHWPVFSLVDYQLYTAPESTRVIWKIAVTTVLTIASFVLVENPARAFLNRPGNRRYAFGFLLASLLVLVPLGLHLRSEYYVNADLRDVPRGGLVFNPSSTRASILLIGDSEGSMYGKLLKDIANQNGYRLTVLSSAATDALPHSNGQPAWLWDQSLAIAKAQKPDFIVLACMWTKRLQEDPPRLEIAVNALKQQTRKLIVMAQSPKLPDDVTRESIRNGMPQPIFELPAERALRISTTARLKTLQDDRVIVEDVAPYFQNSDGSIRWSGPSGRFFFHDVNPPPQHGLRF